MSTTLNNPSTDNTSKWDYWEPHYPHEVATGAVPIYSIPEDVPAKLTNLDRKILLTLHAVVSCALMAAAVVAPASATTRVFIDLGVLAYLATPGVLMVAFRLEHRAWWVVATPLVSALYLWLPNAATGSVYADAHILAFLALVLFAPLLNVVAPIALFAQAEGQAWTIAWYGLAVIAAPGLVYAALAYPLAMA